MASVEVPQLNPATRASASGDTSPGGKGRGRLIALIIGAAALVVGGVVAALTWSGGADEGRSNREAGRGLAGTPVPGPAGQDADGAQQRWPGVWTRRWRRQNQRLGRTALASPMQMVVRRRRRCVL
jgi:hypothetical protein